MHIVQQFVSPSHTIPPNIRLIAPPKPPIALLPARAESLRAREPAPVFQFTDPRFKNLSEQNLLELFAAAEKLLTSAARFLNHESSDMIFRRSVSRYENTLERIRHAGGADNPYTPPDVAALYREMGRETSAEMAAYINETYEDCANILRETEEQIAARHVAHARRELLLRKAGAS